MDLFGSIGDRHYTLHFVDDNTDYVELEISSDSPKPLPAECHRVARAAIMCRFETGADPTVDEIVKQYLHGAAIE
jgi:hypothetical protein